MCHTASGSLPVGVVVVLVILVAAMVILAGVIFYRKVQSQVQRRSVAPKPTTGLSNPLFYVRDNSLPDKRRPPGTPEVVCTNQPPRPTVTPKRPPPAPPAPVSDPPLQVPVYTQQLRPVPPTKPLPKLKPKQVKPNVAPPPTPPIKPGTGGTMPEVTQVKPNVAPPTPPVKPGTGGTMPGVTQRAAGPKVALKFPVQKR